MASGLVKESMKANNLLHVLFKKAVFFAVGLVQVSSVVCLRSCSG